MADGMNPRGLNSSQSQSKNENSALLLLALLACSNVHAAPQHRNQACAYCDQMANKQCSLYAYVRYKEFVLWRQHDYGGSSAVSGGGDSLGIMNGTQNRSSKRCVIAFSGSGLYLGCMV